MFTKDKQISGQPEVEYKTQTSGKRMRYSGLAFGLFLFGFWGTFAHEDTAQANRIPQWVAAKL